jgi:invasion protein IalB
MRRSCDGNRPANYFIVLDAAYAIRVSARKSSGGLTFEAKRTLVMNDQMRTWLSRSLFALGGLIVGAAVGWAGHGSRGDVARMMFYQDWRLICPADAEQKGACGMTSDIVDPRSGTKLAQVSLGTQAGKANEELVVSVPLTVLIPPGVGLQIGGDTKNYPYMTCISTGCVTVIQMDDKLLSAFNSATSVALVVTAQNGRTVNLPMSVKGYSDARKALDNTEARRHSWWRRLWS